MKVDIHPTTHQATVTCHCGNTFLTLSTKEAISTEICSNCHPFYTGKQKFVDSAQRVEKFQAKREQHEQLKAQTKHRSKKDKRAAREEKKVVSVKAAKSEAKDALKAAKDALSGL